MGEKWEKVLSKAIGVNAIEINSALVSAQNRRRLYWTNIGMEASGLFGDLESIIEQPKDREILLRDVLENEVDEKYFLSESGINRITSYNNADRSLDNTDKSLCLAAGYHKQGKDNQLIVHNTNAVEIVAMRGRNPDNPKSRESGLPTIQMLESRSDGKTNCLTSVQKDNLVRGGDYRYDEGFRWRDNNKSGTLPARGKSEGNDFSGQALCKINSRIRRLTPIECERLQTVKDNYTNHVSDSQRYKMLGNGWTVEVITHIFKYIKQ